MYGWLTGVVRRLWREMVGFSVVGLVGVSFDIATFNLVAFGLHQPTVYGSLAGTAIGTLTAYLGNRYWVFRKRDLRQSGAELALFLLVSLMGMGITAACVAFNEYVLGYRGVIAANVAQFLFGQGLGSVFRFWAMHTFVFPQARPPREPQEADDPVPVPARSAR